MNTFSNFLIAQFSQVLPQSLISPEVKEKAITASVNNVVYATQLLNQVHPQLGTSLYAHWVKGADTYFDATPSDTMTPEEQLSLQPIDPKRRTNPKRYDIRQDQYTSNNENMHDSPVMNRYDNSQPVSAGLKLSWEVEEVVTTLDELLKALARNQVWQCNTNAAQPYIITGPDAHFIDYTWKEEDPSVFVYKSRRAANEEGIPYVFHSTAFFLFSIDERDLPLIRRRDLEELLPKEDTISSLKFSWEVRPEHYRRKFQIGDTVIVVPAYHFRIDKNYIGQKAEIINYDPLMYNLNEGPGHISQEKGYLTNWKTIKIPYLIRVIDTGEEKWVPSDALQPFIDVNSSLETLDQLDWEIEHYVEGAFLSKISSLQLFSFTHLLLQRRLAYLQIQGSALVYQDFTQEVRDFIDEKFQDLLERHPEAREHLNSLSLEFTLRPEDYRDTIGAEYYPESKTIGYYLPQETLNDHWSGIVHEIVHALQDFFGDTEPSLTSPPEVTSSYLSDKAVYRNDEGEKQAYQVEQEFKDWMKTYASA